MKNNKKNSKRFNIYILLGIVIIFCAIIFFAYNLYNEINADKYAKEALNQMDFMNKNKSIEDDEIPDYVLNPDIEMPIQTINGIQYVGIISLPTIDINLPVINTCDMDKLKKAPCKYSGSVYKDNMIIAGHNYRKHFTKLKQLQYGDEVVFIDIDGNIFKYVVKEIQVIQEKDISGMEQGDWDLTLFTCNSTGKARVTIRCEKV